MTRVATVAFLALIAPLAATGTSALAQAGGQDESTVVAEAPLVGPAGEAAGTATLLRYGSKLMIEIDASGLSPGAHGAHLHAVGLCEGPKFTSAGGHLNPTMKQHGTLNPMGSHVGDLPNITVEDDGTVVQTIPLTGSANRLLRQIFDADGTAIVIHGGPDDYKTDPSGNSGARVACGVLKRE